MEGRSHTVSLTGLSPEVTNKVEEPAYTHLFIDMEPSGNWLRTEAEGRRKVGEGCVNFATQLNDYILVHAIQKYLLREGEGFDIPDLGGGLDEQIWNWENARKDLDLLLIVG